jgi:hypothetical protein
MIPRGMAIVLMDAGMCAVAEGQVDCSFDDDSNYWREEHLVKRVDKCLDHDDAGLYLGSTSSRLTLSRNVRISLFLFGASRLGIDKERKDTDARLPAGKCMMQLYSQLL